MGEKGKSWMTAMIEHTTKCKRRPTGKPTSGAWGTSWWMEGHRVVGKGRAQGGVPAIEHLVWWLESFVSSQGFWSLPLVERRSLPALDTLCDD